jgi:DHA1 family purine ribonucleoside efflux pump-like MFS transporter
MASLAWRGDPSAITAADVRRPAAIKDGCRMDAVSPDAAQQDAAPAAFWMGVVSLALGSFTLVTSEFLPASLLTRMAADLRISEGVAGQAVTATAIAGMFSALTTAYATRRIDRRTVMLCLTALLIASNAIVALSSSYAALMAGRVLLGIALGGFWSFAMPLASRLVPSASVPKALSIVFTGVSAATVCAAPAGAYLGEVIGWRAVFGVVGALSIGAFVVQWRALPSLPPLGALTVAGILGNARRRGIQLGLAMTLCVASGHFAGFTYVRPLLEQVGHASTQQLALLLLLFSAAGFFGNVAGGAVVAKSVRRGVILSSLLVALATLGLAAMAANAPATALGMALWGFAFGAVPIALQTWMGQASPDHLEETGALFVAMFQVSIMIGAAVGGALLDGVAPQAPFVYAGAATLVAAAAFAWMTAGPRLGKALACAC